jgi:hypothetical protein
MNKDLNNASAMLMKKNSIGFNKIKQEELIKNLVEGMSKKNDDKNPFSKSKEENKNNFKKQYNIASFNPGDKDIHLNTHFKTSVESGGISSRISKLASKFEGGIRNSTISHAPSISDDRKSSNKASVTSTVCYIDPVIELLNCINEGKIKNLKDELARLENLEEKDEQQSEDEDCVELNKDLILNRKRSKGIEISKYCFIFLKTIFNFSQPY